MSRFRVNRLAYVECTTDSAPGSTIDVAVGDDQFRFELAASGLRSAPVEPGVVYAFDTGHCGLDFLTDFDGSFWMPINPDGTGDPSVFFYNRDVGAIVLADAEHAWYRSSDGRIVTLERVEGPVTTYPCA